MKTVLIVNSQADYAAKLSSLVDWNKYHAKLIGSVTDGTTAMEFILRKLPDMVFIEIGLPDINGLDVIARIREHGLITEFIITEDTGSFEYAQRAMRLGVQEYLLNPVTKVDIVRILDRQPDQHALPQSNKELESYLFSTRRLLRNSFMRNFVSAEEHQEFSIDSLNRQYHLTFKEGYFQIALVQLRNLPKDEEGYFLPVIVEELRARFDPVCNEMVPFIQGSSRLALLFNYEPGSDVGDKLSEIKDVTVNALRDRGCTGTFYSIGIGRPSRDVNDLLSLLHSAERAAYCGALRGSNKIYYFEKLTFDSVTVEDAVTPEFLKEIEIGVESMDFRRYEQALLNAFKVITSQTDPEVIVKICEQAIIVVAQSLGDSEAVTREEIRKILYKVMNAASISAIIAGLVDNARTKLESAQKKREFSRPVREATKYIKNNFTKNITLEDVADHVHLNASYLSMLFKKETGTNYIGFLTECRIDEAKKLLKDSSLSVAEICYAVGYTDKKHFSRLFIKHVGVRPTTYRSLH